MMWAALLFLVGRPLRLPDFPIWATEAVALQHFTARGGDV